MKRYLTYIICMFATLTSLRGETTIRSNGEDRTIMVDGKPFLILGGELSNSGATSPADIEASFPKLRAMNLNTVLVPAYWDLTEPEQGVFDFSLTEKVIDTARENGLKVVFLWFGAWKNSMSCYAPAWIKADWRKYPRAVTRSGKPLEIASAFSAEVLDADLKAFTLWLKHIKDYDKSNTVIMYQIENEIGMLEDARDYSNLANKAWDEGVPRELTSYLHANENSLHNTLANRWNDNGRKATGSWNEVFGEGVETDEYFMAWHYGKYVGRMAQAAKEITCAPLYVNAALNSRGRHPGEYPSAGPLAHLKDIWHAAAPDLDFLSPDIYDSGFTNWVKQYSLPDNALFIPEIRKSDANAAQAFYVFGEHDALGFSPFSIDTGSQSRESKLSKAYALLSQLTPIITSFAGSADMRGVYFDADSVSESFLSNDGIKITASHYFTLPWDARATDGSRWPETGAVIIRLAPMEYLIAGNGVVVKFENPEESPIKANLGEDGFLSNTGSNDETSGWKPTKRIGLISTDEVTVNDDGSLGFVRRDNGDETHQGRHVRIGVDDFRILHVKLYEYM